MARYCAFLDACVLVPIALADTLLRLAEAGLYRPLWSDRVLDEMVDAIGQIHPDLASGPARPRADAMQTSLEDACVTSCFHAFGCEAWTNAITSSPKTPDFRP